ncbi:UDP-N-acetylmuramoyl-tripeptide--D-alanyl-D-alanine ligase [Pallidibacillus pasinlerensis]|uniref:UDP-N-acetylmuramoyl-tripeptide--D-alanyl-D-alanine ligase n=1 Tax=Pallidibacillus pasinlerensis TaxID=2703818 RepID=A0ABX0A3Z6_9BACI|nr:UDP-N-acetylmuramoyl-tripeptide--D-alanyl-D-alanine ligase [Pallidibacillus pasinlerensis]NCU17537.1 UDP-N-acetylmuramoyl-tripeptide--D-alanyl-D-alanine ligase [Pallidibacillus pasinlerensis]
MIKRTLEQISEMITGAKFELQFANKVVTGVSINTREIQSGNLFVPLKGENRDGHEFVHDAFKQGASVTLWQKDVPNPPQDVPIIFVDDTLEALQQLAGKYREQLPIKVVAVTGSNGKTTTKDILAGLLSVNYKVQKTQGNFNNHIGLPLTLLSLKEDTEVAVLEMGMSDFGEIDLLTKLAKPDVALITNIGDAHLQDLGSREGIAKAKLEIVNGLKDNGLFVYPGDEPLLKEQLVSITKPIRTKTFGKSTNNDFYANQIEFNDSGTAFKTNVTDLTFHLPFLGEYNVMNALAAMIVANEFGVSYPMMNTAFAQIKLTEMRMEITRGINGAQILNDAYNASPTSVKAVIDLVATLSGFSRKIVVLGDMLELGPKEKQFHIEIGEYINPNKIQYVFTYGKLASYIAEGARTNFEQDRVFSFEDKQELIKKLQTYLDENSFVLVKASRGMRLEEVVEAIKEEF